MAGKADMVNSIADSTAAYLQDVPQNDGCKDSVDVQPDPAPGGSLLLDPFGGAAA